MVWNSLSRRAKTGNYGRQMTIKQDNDTVGSYFLLKNVNIPFKTADMRQMWAQKHVSCLNEMLRCCENAMFPPSGRWEKRGDARCENANTKVAFSSFCTDSVMHMWDATFLLFKNNLCGRRGCWTLCVRSSARVLSLLNLYSIHQGTVQAFTCHTESYLFATCAHHFIPPNLLFCTRLLWQQWWLHLKKAIVVRTLYTTMAKGGLSAKRQT